MLQIQWNLLDQWAYLYSPSLHFHECTKHWQSQGVGGSVELDHHTSNTNVVKFPENKLQT